MTQLYTTEWEFIGRVSLGMLHWSNTVQPCEYRRDYVSPDDRERYGEQIAHAEQYHRQRVINNDRGLGR